MFCNFIRLQLTHMKNALMRHPAITQIYNQKMTYENHLRKLTQIREDRKHQLQYDHSRQAQLTHIKQTKSKSFAHKFNEQNLQINQSNVKFLNKLEKVKPFTRHTSYTSTDRINREPTFINSITKRKMVETEKENSRLFFKMKSVSSTLSKDRMMNDYAKAQRIKERITKYANDNKKIALKSQKYFSNNPNKSLMSNRSSEQGSTNRLKKSLASHYKKEDIIKNRISNTQHRIFKQKRQTRPLPSLGDKQFEIEEDASNYVEEKNAFFTTEPQKDKKRAVSTTRRIC